MKAAREQSSSLSHFCRRLWWRSRLLDSLLLWSSVRGLHPIAPDLWPADEELGNGIMKGHFTFYGEKLLENQETIWEPYGISLDSQASLHQFEWLGSLRALGNQDARLLSRALVSDWIEKNSQWHPISWRPDVMGGRLSAWLGYYDFFGASGDQEFRQKFYRSLARQSLYLRFMRPKDVSSLQRLLGIMGLVVTQLAIPGQERALRVTMNALYQSLSYHLMEDGMHSSGNPEIQAHLLKNLVRIRSNLRQGSLTEEYPFIQNALDKMSPMVRFFRHGDGSLAIFNGGEELSSDLIDMILSQSDARGRPPEASLSSGFDRLTGYRSLVFVDWGGQRPQSSLRTVGSLEMSQGSHRLLVNGGQAKGGYRRFVSSDFASQGQNIFIWEGVGGPTHGKRLRREENEGATLLETLYSWSSHPSVSYKRSLYLSADGKDFRGREEISGHRESFSWSLRFHLGPGLKASPTSVKNLWILKSSDNTWDTTWHFQCSEDVLLQAEEGVYLGKNLQACTVLEITGKTSPQPFVLKWAFKQVMI